MKTYIPMVIVQPKSKRTYGNFHFKKSFGILELRTRVTRPSYAK